MRIQSKHHRRCLLPQMSPTFETLKRLARLWEWDNLVSHAK